MPASASSVLFHSAHDQATIVLERPRGNDPQVAAVTQLAAAEFGSRDIDAVIDLHVWCGRATTVGQFAIESQRPIDQNFICEAIVRRSGVRRRQYQLCRCAVCFHHVETARRSWPRSRLIIEFNDQVRLLSGLFTSKDRWFSSRGVGMVDIVTPQIVSSPWTHTSVMDFNPPIRYAEIRSIVG